MSECNGTVHEPTTIINADELVMAESSRIDSFCVINANGGLEMRERSCIHAGSHVVGSDSLLMKARSVVTYNAVLLTSTADLRYPASSVVPKEERESTGGGITIGREAFIGSNAVVAPGVEIGDGAVVAANSYVDEDIPRGKIRYPGGWLQDRPIGPWKRFKSGSE